MEKIREVINRIRPIQQSAYEDVKKRLNNLTKPAESLGRLEELAQRYIAIKGDNNAKLEKKVIFTFAGDHGVADEGVSAFPREVTAQMVLNFLHGGAGVNVLARHVGAEVVVVDIGVDYDFKQSDGLVIRKIARGTRNMLKEPAMTYKEAIRGMKTGIEIAEEWSQRADIVGTGDMGIGNTTPSSAIVSVLTGEPVENVTGMGTGITHDTFKRKIDIIKEAIKINKPNPLDPIDVLSKVGGFEIAGIAGLILGAASKNIPVVVDGFISGASALIALRLQPAVRDYIFTSHLSVERGHKVIIEKLGTNALLDLNLRLGEGTGAALGIGLVEAGFKILTQMATFDNAGVSTKAPSPIYG
ncbi:MAG: nicotinate-nucleotide--dimethylbenzimidazole phosphoribosyltransferase [Nitrospinae bacterium]|nr:nicotinate-nucleotide--dimethylbenzimidazole phosphoribosyltransferase [Nitrospinota bacterium]